MFVTEEERDALVKLSHQIAELAASKIEGFRTCFPFGQPKDDLKMNIKLLSIVSRCVCVCVLLGYVILWVCDSVCMCGV